jgi:1-deoxy-D-xylulose-5-phosphate synthase
MNATTLPGINAPGFAARIEPFEAAASAPLLPDIDEPTDLRRLEPEQLTTVAAELRQYLVQSVASCGGHLSAGLGTVELTVALHYCFDTPRDSLVWDVGHQCYPHKVLTGRREQLTSIRQRGGLSGFLRRDESVYDSFGAGHSSTSISAALGIAVANAQLGIDQRSVAIIGDGGMTAGLAYEALDHAGAMEVDLLVVLNDNRMSISPNVGAISRYLTRIIASRPYTSVRDSSRRFLALFPPLLALADRLERQVKGMIAPGQLFEELGFAYYGPVDGHDLPTLVSVLKDLQRIRGPRLLHVVTNKGQGYAPAEADPVKYHGVTPFDPRVGVAGAKAAASSTYTQVFGQWLCEAAVRDPRVVAITPAMREGSGMVEFAQRFPERFFDVGIAEQHCVTFAAGLAVRGLKPVVAIYSTFLQRAYDQLIHDVALQNLPVVFAIDRAGLVGPDGATHNGSYDLSYLRCVPGMTIMVPANGRELNHMLDAALAHDGPVAVRYPREAIPDHAEREQERAAKAAAAAEQAVDPATGAAMVPVKPAAIAREIAPEIVPEITPGIVIGKSQLRRQGRGIALLVFGPLLNVASQIGESLDATVINMRFVKPLDVDAVLAAARTHELVVTLEENAIAGGAGSAVSEAIAAAGLTPAMLHLGLPDTWSEHGTRAEVLRDAGLDAAGIRAAIAARLAQTSLVPQVAVSQVVAPQVVAPQKELRVSRPATA